MKTFRILKTTLSARFENLLTNVENQEAVIDAAVNDIKEVLVNTKIQLRDVEKGIHRARKGQQDTQAEIDTWEKRVVEVHSSDPELARECTYKVILLKNEIDQCEITINQGKHDLTRLEKEKSLIQDKLREIQARKHELLTKQNISKVNGTGQTTVGSVEDIFNRWEEKLIKDETLVDHSYVPDKRDEVEKYFDQKEREKQIEDELNNIINNK